MDQTERGADHDDAVHAGRAASHARGYRKTRQRGSDRASLLDAVPGRGGDLGTGPDDDGTRLRRPGCRTEKAAGGITLADAGQFHRPPADRGEGVTAVSDDESAFLRAIIADRDSDAPR